MTEFVTPQLRTVLKTYQNSATKSLQGPGQSLSHHHHNNNTLALSPGSIVKKELNSPEPCDVNDQSIISITVPQPPELPQPILTAPDTGRGELYETILEGKPIGCFLLGGEMRLCLPQFLNNVLTDFTLEEINRIFDDLRIFCSQCTPEQLMEFKAAKILPHDVKASGLITRTDAERLCSALLHRSDRSIIDIPKGAISFKVYHRCFGKCEGICTPDLYSYLKPACVMCLECNGMFSPQKFVGHVHRQQENRTCHWGFDSRNWRDYLHVALDVENREKYTKMLDDLRDLEQQEMLNAQRDISCLKRKAEMMDDPIIVPPPCKREPLDIPSKKSKIIEESTYLLEYQRYQHQVSALFYAQCAQREQQLSAFRPWAPKPILHLPYSTVAAAAAATLPYLSQEPPILQNPERVVRHTECERFERTFQPNVALAPRKSILSKEREREKEQQLQRERDRDREREKEREREREREREKERERERERDQENAATITNLCETEIQIKQEIKQERPSSPEIIAQSPEELCSASPINTSNNLHLQHHSSRHHHHHHHNQYQHQSRHNQCTTSATLSSNTAHHTTPTPISPEEFSGSNEITSSTSPVPNINNGCSRATPPTPPTMIAQHQQQTSTAAIVAAINHQKTADNNMIVCVPNRIQLSSNIGKLGSNSNMARSPTPPSLREYSSINNSFKMRTIRLQSPPTQSSSSSSSNINVGLNSGTTIGGVLIKNIINGNGGNSLGAVGVNSEFELSTDTDDDSLVGEPDSSNMIIPWDIASEALKDTPPGERDKIIQVIKMLVHENAQLRHYAIENAKLQQELRSRDEQIIELQQELQHLQRKLTFLSSTNQSAATSSILNSASKQKISGNIGVIAKAESCLAPQKQQQNDISATPAQSMYHQKPESEKIKVPLKKSSRRSPEETVVVLNQNLQQQHRDDVITEMKNDLNNGSSNTSTTTSSASSCNASLSPPATSHQIAKSLPISTTTNTSTASSQAAVATSVATTTISSPDSVEFELKQHQQQKQQQQQHQSNGPSIKCE